MMREILVRNFDSTNPDFERDRMGCRKRGMVDAIFRSPHSWGRLEGLPKFVIIKVDLDQTDIDTFQGFRKIWKDNFDYEILATRPAQGEYDVRIFETAAGASGQNAMTGAKLIRVRDYLIGWGCSNFAAATGGGSFTFNLWDAVRSQNFWNVPLTAMIGLVFDLESYNSQTGIGRINIDYSLTQIKPEMVVQKIEERGGNVLSAGALNAVFEIERSDILTRFREDVKQRIEQVFMYQQYRIDQDTMDAAVAAGGTLTLTKAELLASIVDSTNG